MRGKFIRALILLSATVAAVGCKKVLDLNPTDVIEASVALESVADLDKAVTGVYAAMSTTSIQIRSASAADIIISSLMSDENYLPTENTTGNGANMYRWLITPNEPYTWANWGVAATSGTVSTTYNGTTWAVIDRANRVLRVIDDIPASNADEQKKKIRLKGELLAIRAFYHFRILKTYAEDYEPTSLGIPYMESINDAPAAVKPSRLTVAETFEKIEADLEEAKSLLTSAPFTDVTRINAAGVNAIKARVYLYEKKWQEAANAATELINSFPLATAAQFSGIWSDSSNVEVIWKIKKDTDNDKIGFFYRTSSGAVEYGASPKLISAFTSNDVRFKTYVSVESRGTGKTPYLVNKYALNKSTAGLADIKLFRVAEMYLIRAEAYAELSSNNAGDLQLGVNDLNTLRTARITAYSSNTVYTKQSLIDSVYAERFRELAFEGHRYFDLRRRSLPINRNPIASDDAAGKDNSLLTSDKKEYYMPIPGFELQANENMIQNRQYR